LHLLVEFRQGRLLGLINGRLGLGEELGAGAVLDRLRAVLQLALDALDVPVRRI
jgi:hypothetical protein